MLARSTLIYAPAILAPRAAAFALVILLSRALPKAEFGLYALVIVVGEMLDMGAANWLRLSLLRLDIARPETWRDAAARCLALSAAGLLGLTVLATAAGALLARERFAAFTLTVFLYAAAQGALRLGLTVLQLLRRDGVYSALEVGRSALLLAAVAWAASTSQRFEAAALANAAAAAIAAIACLVYGLRALPPGGAKAAPLSARLAYGAPLIAVGFAASMLTGADRIFLKLLSNAAAVAAYAAAYALARAPLDVVANAVNLGGFPELMRRYETGGVEAAADFTREAFEVQSLLLLGAGAILVALTPALAQTLLPADYREAAGRLAPLIALGTVFLSLKVFVFDNVFHALKRNVSQAATYLPAGAVTLLACLLLIPRTGTWGAAAAFALGSATGLATSAAYAWRSLPLRLRPFELAKAAAAAIAAGGAASAAIHLSPFEHPGSIALGAVVGAVTWGGAALLLRPAALRGLVSSWAITARLAWSLRRLSRMGPAEVLHRVRERFLHSLDAMRPAGWDGFGGSGMGSLRGSLAAEPGRASEAMIAVARDEAAKAIAGNFDYLGQAWPAHGRDWPHGEAWRLDPLSGRPWPDAGWRSLASEPGRGDVKYVWELNRLPFFGALGLAAHAGDEDAAAFAYEALSGWMAANPPYAGVNWTSGIEIASRIASVLWLVACAPPPTQEDDRRVRAFLDAHGRRLARFPSLHSSANNHRVAELAGLLLASAALPEAPASARWRALSRAGLEAEVLRQFHPDGVGAEQSPTYAAYGLEWFVLAGLTADARGEPMSSTYRQAVLRAAEALRWLLDETGRPPRIGDDDEGRVLTLRQAPEARYVASVVALARRWLGEPPLDPALHDADLRDLLGPPAAGAALSAPSGRRTFSGGGVTVFREETGRGLALLTFDHGPLGYLSIAAHGHADALSVTLQWGDESVLIDPSAYLYHSGGALRDALRGTAAHNTICIEGEDQSRIIGPFAWDRHARTTLSSLDETGVEAEHDGYLRRYGVLCRRKAEVLQPGVWCISDRLAGRSSRATAWRAGFTLGPGCAATIDGRTASIHTLGGRSLTLTAEGHIEGGWTAHQVPWSPRFGRLEETVRLEVAGRMLPTAAETAFAVTIDVGDRS